MREIRCDYCVNFTIGENCNKPYKCKCGQNHIMLWNEQNCEYYYPDEEMIEKEKNNEKNN